MKVFGSKWGMAPCLSCHSLWDWCCVEKRKSEFHVCKSKELMYMLFSVVFVLWWWRITVFAWRMWSFSSVHVGAIIAWEYVYGSCSHLFLWWYTLLWINIRFFLLLLLLLLLYSCISLCLSKEAASFDLCGWIRRWFNEFYFIFWRCIFHFIKC